MTNEDKLKRIEELEIQILFSKKEISDIKDSMKYEEDFTGRYYQKKNSNYMFAKVIDGKLNECLVLQFELHENLYDEDVIPENNEFSLNVYLSWMSKRLLETNWVHVDKYESGASKHMRKISTYMFYMLKHFGQ